MAAQIGLETISVTIANGTSLSAAVNLGSGRLRGLALPAAWTAAALSFQVSLEGPTFVELTDPRPAGVAYATATGMAAAASQYLAIDPVLFEGAAVIKIRSGVSGTPVNQGADRILTLSTRL